MPEGPKVTFVVSPPWYSEYCRNDLFLSSRLSDGNSTLKSDVEARFVLWIVTVEKEAGLVRGAEQWLGDEWTAVSVNDGARLQRSTADL